MYAVIPYLGHLMPLYGLETMIFKQKSDEQFNDHMSHITDGQSYVLKYT